jgi:hypothetical protein
MVASASSGLMKSRKKILVPVSKLTPDLLWCCASPSDHSSLDYGQSEQQHYSERTGISL